MKTNYEKDDAAFPAAAYAVRQYPGVAFWVWGWELQPDADTDWTGQETRTGNVLVTMIGDDRRFSFDPEDVSPIKESAYCHSCGQIGCLCDVRED